MSPSETTKEDSATQPMEAGRLSFAFCPIKVYSKARKIVPKVKEKVTQPKKSEEKVNFFLRY